MADGSGKGPSQCITCRGRNTLTKCRLLYYVCCRPMTPQRITTLRIDEEIWSSLEMIRERDGVPISEQVRRALRPWLESKGVKIKAAPRRATTRRKA